MFLKKNDIYNDTNYINNMISTLAVGERVKAYIRYYALYAAKKCKWSKRFYYFLNILIIVLPFVSFFVNYIPGQLLTWRDLVDVGLSCCVSISGALISLFRFHDKWTRYRGYLEKLISIVFEYAEDNTIDSEKKLVADLIVLNKEHMSSWEGERSTDKV